MKKLLLILCLLGLPCFAAQNVLVLYDYGAGNNYGFPEVSEIIASDVVGCFSDKVRVPQISDVNKRLGRNESLKNFTRGALGQFKNTKTIDYAAYTRISKEFGTDYVLVILSSVNNSKCSLWEVLQVASDFNTAQSVVLNTNAILIDTRSGLVMWSKTYNKKIEYNGEDVTAQLESLRMYSADILAPDISQNIVLRFYPRSVRSIVRDVKGTDSGGILRYDRTNPKPKSNIDSGNYGETLFSL
jgi:hypothetical protein